MVVKLAQEVLPHVSKITIIIAGTAEALTFAMISDKKDKGIAVVPINIRGTAEEVEAELAGAIAKIFTENKQLFSNVEEAATAVKEAAKKPVTASGTKSGPKSKTSTKKEDEKDDDDDAEDEKEEAKPAPSKLTPTQIKVQKDQKKNFERAEKATDVDVVNFVENEISKAYKAALMPEDVFVDLKVKFDGIRDKMGKPKEEAPSVGMFAGGDASAGKEQVKEPAKEKEKVPVTKPAAEPVVEKKAEPAPAAAASSATEEEEIIF
jgi:PRTRC genetic system protein E